MVGYLSFYFDIDNFTDRAMVVLTTMLVIATITSSIESVIYIYQNYMQNVLMFKDILQAATDALNFQ